MPHGAISPNEPAPPIIAREGWPIVGAFVGATVLASALGLWVWAPAGWFTLGIGVILSAWCLWFFRDPQRPTPTEAGAVICPADGVVVAVDRLPPPAEIGLGSDEAGGLVRVSIFMNVFNVHVNRSPLAGTVERVRHRPGAFFNAAMDKASELNERCSLLMRMPAPDGRVFVVVQIAGLIARRIVCKVREGAVLGAGQRFGLIRFGSRVDCFMPAGSVARVRPGDKVVAGLTVIGSVAAGTPSTAESKPAGIAGVSAGVGA